MTQHQSGYENAYVFMSRTAAEKYDICPFDNNSLKKEWDTKDRNFREQAETLMAGIKAFSNSICAVPLPDAQHGVNPDDKCILGIVTQADSKGTFKKAPYNAANPTNKWTIEQAKQNIDFINNEKSRAA